MREILFRAKRQDNGKWIEGSFVKYTDYDGDKVYLIYASNGNPNNIIPETVGQFTGLTDKNGNKIFEDDIIKIRRTYLNAGYEEDCFYKVAWHKYWNGWALINIKSTQSCYLDNVIQGEVIGNIHVNPELLGE